MTEKNDQRNRFKLQIQPRRKDLLKWEMLSAAEDLNYEVLELSTPPALNEPRRCESYMEWYRQSGRAASVHGCFVDVNPGSGDLAFRELSRRRCVESCEAARRIGAKHVVLHSSCAPFLRGAYLEGWADACAGFYEELAQKYDLFLCIENSSDVDSEPLKELMRRTSDSRVCVCLDVGHAHYSRLTLEEWFADLGERIGYLHLSDNCGLFDEHLPLGEGTVDWALADRLWRSLGRSIPVTVENNNPDSAARSIHFLKEHGYFLELMSRQEAEH